MATKNAAAKRKPQRRNTSPRVFIPANLDQELHTVKQLAHAETALTEGGIRWTIFTKAQALREAGALVEVGRRKFLNKRKYLDAIAAGKLAGAA